METEQYSGGVDDKHPFFDNYHDFGNIDLALINALKFSYYDRNLPTVSHCVTSGRYTLRFDPKINDIKKNDINWNDSIAQKAERPLHGELLYALLLHAQTKNGGPCQCRGPHLCQEIIYYQVPSSAIWP